MNAILPATGGHQQHSLRSYRLLSFVFALVALVAAAPSLLIAQSGVGTVTGRVLNQATGQYLRAALVVVEGTQLSTVSEAGGDFRLLDVPAGTRKLIVTYEGLDPVEAVVNVGAGQTVDREIVMTSATYDKDVVKLGAFVVATEKEGNAKAVNEQKQALEMKTVIAADAFGDVSEGNVGEFLKLMPGINIDYVEADARSISIGGMDPKYTTVLMDGQPISSAASSGMGRTFELEQLSITSIETVELSKTPTPDVSGSAMAGVVNLRSKGAFDRKGRQIRWGAAATANSMDMTLGRTAGWDDSFHYKIAPSYYVEASDIFLNNRLGVIVGYNHSFTFSEQKAQTYTWTWDADPSNNATEIPKIASLTFRDSPKPSIRKNYSARVDFKATPNLWFWARMDYNTYKARFFSRDLALTFTANRTINGPGGPTEAGTEFSLLSQTSDTVSTSINQGGGATNKHGFTSTPAAGMSYKRGPFSMEAQVQYSLSTNWYTDVDDGFFWSTQTQNLTGLKLRWSRPGVKSDDVTITQLSGPDWRNLASYPNGFNLLRTYRHGEDANYSGKVDFRYSGKVWVPVLFKWGLSSIERSRHIPYNFNTGSSGIAHVGADKTANTADDSPALYPEPYYRMNFNMGGNVDGIANMDRWALAREYQAHPDWFTTPSASTLLQSRVRSYNLVREQVDAFYLQPIVKVTPKFDIAPGLRVERTRGFGRGPSDLGDALTRLKLTGGRTGTVDTTSPDYILTRYEPRAGHLEPYNTALKYLHTNYKFTKDLIGRASYNESITRPDLNRMFPGITGINDTADPHTVTIGNPDLRPEKARNIYLSLEYYMRNAGFATVSVARRDIKDLIRSVTYDVPVDGELWGDPFWAGYRVSSVDNVAKAHNSSLELSYRSQNMKFLPSYLSGLSFFSNGTFIKYDNINNFLRPKKLANAGVSYRWKDFSAYWRVNWTGTQRTAANNAAGVARFYAPRTMQDVGADFMLRRGLTFYITGRNIFNAVGNEEYSTRPDVLQRRVYTGAIWNFGIKGVF